MRNLFAWLAASSLLLVLAGCGANIGEYAISTNRIPYNEAINTTSTQQMLLNVVRARDGHPPTFLTLYEVTGTNTVEATINGGPTGLGSIAGAVGAITGTARIADSPTTKYTNLSGADLVKQVSYPITLGSFARLQTVAYPLSPMFNWGFIRLTPNFIDHYRAVDTISALDDLGAITVDTVVGNEQILVIDFHGHGNFGIDTAHLAQDSYGRGVSCVTGSKSPDATARQLWKNLLQLFNVKGSPNKLALSQSGAKVKGLVSQPVVTAAANFSLRGAEDGEGLIRFVSLEKARAVIEANRSSGCAKDDFYYIPQNDSQTADQMWSKQANLVANEPNSRRNSLAHRQLSFERAAILVVESREPIQDTFVSIEREGKWYGILNKDKTSRLNFTNLSHLLTVQGSPSPPPTPTTTAIIPGGK